MTPPCTTGAAAAPRWRRRRDNAPSTAPQHSVCSPRSPEWQVDRSASSFLRVQIQTNWSVGQIQTKQFGSQFQLIAFSGTVCNVPAHPGAAPVTPVVAPAPPRPVPSTGRGYAGVTPGLRRGYAGVRAFQAEGGIEAAGSLFVRNRSARASVGMRISRLKPQNH